MADGIRANYGQRRCSVLSSLGRRTDARSNLTKDFMFQVLRASVGANRSHHTAGGGEALKAARSAKPKRLEARPVDLRFGKVKAARSNCRKPEFAGSDDETAQPGAGTAARVEEAGGRGARGPQVGELSIQDSPNVPVVISVQPVEYKQVFRIAIRIRSVFVASFIVDRGYVLALVTLSGLTGL